MTSATENSGRIKLDDVKSTWASIRGCNTRQICIRVYRSVCTRLVQVSTPFFFSPPRRHHHLRFSFLSFFLFPLLSFVYLSFCRTFSLFFFFEDNTPVGRSLRVFECTMTTFNQARYNMASRVETFFLLFFIPSRGITFLFFDTHIFHTAHFSLLSKI